MIQTPIEAFGLWLTLRGLPFLVMCLPEHMCVCLSLSGRGRGGEGYALHS